MSAAGRTQERRSRRQRRSRRRATTAATKGSTAASSWLRGAGQYGFAAVLAGILLIAIIALRGRDGESESETEWGSQQQPVQAAGEDVERSQWEQAAEATQTRGSDRLLQAVAGRAAAAKREPMARSTGSIESAGEDSTRRVVGFGNGQQEVGAGRAGGSTFDANGSPYPTTDVNPVAPTRTGGHAQDTGSRVGGWRETLPSDPVRNATRRTQPGFEHRR